MPKNLRRIPPEILLRLRTFALDDVVAACAKRIRPSDVERYSHLGLRIADGALVTPPPAIPNPAAGKYSTYNVEGKDIVRKDLPKTTKTFSFYAPNWGDSSNGTHLVSRTREVYQREFIPPKGVELSVTLIEQQADTWIVKFAIDQVINRSAPDFEGELLYNLNILQENVAAADVFESVATFADYAATIRVDCVPPTVSAQIGAALAYRDGNDVLRHDETDIRVGNATSRCATGQGVQQDGEIR